MAEMVGAAVVQEVVSGAFSLMRNNHEEMACQKHLIERLQYAHLELKFALERTKRMPMIEVSLLQRRMMIKHAFKESRDLLYKLHTLRVNLEDEGAEQGVTLAPSLPNRIMHAVKPFFGTEKGSLSGSCVRRFELFAEKADKFVRDVESGYSLALYRFSCPLVAQLLDGKWLHYRMSLEPQFKSVADVASGELAQISTQVGVFRPEPADREHVFNLMTKANRYFRQEPLCCIGDGFQPSAKNILSSELTERFPEQVGYLGLECFISAAEYNLKSSTVETNRNTIKAWPILHMSVSFHPHYLFTLEDGKVLTYLVTFLDNDLSPGNDFAPLDCLDLSKMAKFLPVQAVDYFNLEPGRTEYKVFLFSAHGLVTFTVSKPTTEMGCTPKIGDRSKTRRASKRKR